MRKPGVSIKLSRGRKKSSAPVSEEVEEKVIHKSKKSKPKKKVVKKPNGRGRPKGSKDSKKRKPYKTKNNKTRK